MWREKFIFLYRIFSKAYLIKEVTTVSIEKSNINWEPLSYEGGSNC